MVTDIVFSAKFSKMGDNRIIWIPKSLSEMIKPFEDEKRVLVKIMSTNTKNYDWRWRICWQVITISQQCENRYVDECSKAGKRSRKVKMILKNEWW